MHQPWPPGMLPPHPRRNRWGPALLWVLVVTLLVGTISFGFTALSAAVAHDVCRVDCDGDINAAVGISLGGIALGVVVGVAGSIWAKRRGHPGWPWPTMTFAIIVVTGVIGGWWLNSIVLSPSY